MRSALRDLVLDEGIVDEAALQAAIRRARRAGEPLLVALVEGGVDEGALLALLARSLRLPVVDPATTFDPDAVRELPHELARRRRVLPLSVDEHPGGRVLRVAMADPTDDDARAEIELATGRRLDLTLAALGALDAAIATAYRGFTTAVMRPDGDIRPDAERPAGRALFGGDLRVATPAAPLADDRRLRTQPDHRLEDEAPLELRHRALLDLLVRKGVVTPEEYCAEIRGLLKDRE